MPLGEGAVWPLDPGTEERANPLLVEDETRPPPRYRPHTLIKAMKDAGIGRPSTYSRTVEKLEERSYVTLEDGALVPTERGRIVWLHAAPLYAKDGEDGGVVEELFSPEFTALMEERLDRIAEGEESAPASWEEWRDEIRDLHNIALEKKRAGGIVPHQKHRLERLLENAPEDVRTARSDLSTLSYEEADALIQELRDAGIHPAPTERQMDYLRELATDLSLDEGELEELTGFRTPDDIRTSHQASAAIDELRRVYDERKPASAKQRRFIEDLVSEAGMSRQDAAGLVGASSLDELTGGAEGTASALIDRLQELAKKAS